VSDWTPAGVLTNFENWSGAGVDFFFKSEYIQLKQEWNQGQKIQTPYTSGAAHQPAEDSCFELETWPSSPPSRDEHGSGLDRTGSGLTPILAGSGLDRTAILLKIGESGLDRTEKFFVFLMWLF